MNTFKQFLIWWNNKKGSTHACLLWFIKLLPVNVITCQYYQQKVEDLRQTTNKSYEYFEKVDMDHLFHRIFFQWFSFLTSFGPRFQLISNTNKLTGFSVSVEHWSSMGYEEYSNLLRLHKVPREDMKPIEKIPAQGQQKRTLEQRSWILFCGLHCWLFTI